MWQCEAGVESTAFAALLASWEALQSQLGRPDAAIVSGAPGQNTCVYRIPVSDTACYVKVYRESRPLRSRGQQEWKNLCFLQSAGVAVPEVLAFGAGMESGRRTTVLVTKQVEGSVDLATLMRDAPERFSDPVWFPAFCIALGEQVRRMHDAGFAHNDLNWRNILVSVGREAPKVWIFDCPSGRRWVWPFLPFRICKDLTHLDKMGRRYLRASQRLRFFKAYCHHRVLTRADKVLARKVLGRKVHPKYRPVGSGG